MPKFTPPTMEEGSASGGPLFGRYRLTHGVTVLKKDGAYTQLRYPTSEQILDADIAYIGGYEYQVSDAEASALAAAGYTTAPTGYGEGAYGNDKYGS